MVATVVLSPGDTFNDLGTSITDDLGPIHSDSGVSGLWVGPGAMYTRRTGSDGEKGFWRMGTWEKLVEDLA